MEDTQEENQAPGIWEEVPLQEGHALLPEDRLSFQEEFVPEALPDREEPSLESLGLEEEVSPPPRNRPPEPEPLPPVLPVIETIGSEFSGDIALLRDDVQALMALQSVSSRGIQALQSEIKGIKEFQERVHEVQDLSGQILEARKMMEELKDFRELGEKVQEMRERVEDLSRGLKEEQKGQDVSAVEREEGSLSGEGHKVPFPLEALLQVMIKHRASDLHIIAGNRPVVRLEGELIPVGSHLLSVPDTVALLSRILTKEQKSKIDRTGTVDFAYSLGEARFRVNVHKQRNSLAAAIRMMRSAIPTIEELNLPQALKKLASLSNGLVLVTGPAGAGKSTTLAAMIEWINQGKKKHVITIEDPIEYVHKDRLSLITQREIGNDTTSFFEALKEALRQDPDVILIGEMRDAETIWTAAMAAETGHLVLSTLHTPNTIQAVDRILDAFSGEQQRQFRQLLANTLRGVVSQRLLTRAAPLARELGTLGEPPEVAWSGSGRIPAVEVLIVTPTIAGFISEGKTKEIYPLIAEGSQEGMQTFTESLAGLFRAGLITKEEALYHADHPNELRLGLEGHSTGTYSGGDQSSTPWL